MNLIENRRVPERLMFALIVIVGVFIKSTAAADSINVDNLSNLYEAARLSKTLANRNHTKIDSLRNLFIDKLFMEVDLHGITHNHSSYLEGVIANHKLEWTTLKQSTTAFSASNEALINTIFDQILGNGANTADQLNAQIIRQQLAAPMKVVQSLLSFAIVELDSDAPNKKELLSRIVDQLKFKPRVFGQVLDDFDFLLRQGSLTLISVKRAINVVAQRANEITESNYVPAIDALVSLSNEWTKLPNALEKAKPKDAPEKVVSLLNRMKSLVKCAELGLAAYRDCQNNPAKLAAYSAHVDKSSGVLQRWREYEQIAYGIVIPALKKIQESSDQEPTTKITSLIQSVLPKLDNYFVEMQQAQLYTGDFNRVYAETNKLIRQTTGLIDGAQVLSDRERLLLLIKPVGSIDIDDAELKKKKLNDQITSNLLLEACMRARESLKLYAFAIDHDWLELCDIPSPPPAAAASDRIDSKHIEQSIRHNLQILEQKIQMGGSRNIPGADYVLYNSRFPNERPFFVWKYKDVKDDIKRLLSGELVTLNTDILASQNQNAVKFNKFVFDFRLAKAFKQSEFYNVINGMRFDAEIIGSNYYRCDKRVYYVPTDVRISNAYTIQINDANEIDVVYPNQVYAAIAGNKPFLSPYNIWQIKFTDRLGMDQQLKKFIGEEIDLHLIGMGTETINYDDAKEMCNNDALKKNYRLDRILK